MKTPTFDRTYLFDRFIRGIELELPIGCGVPCGFIRSIEREDGSGNCWNVTIRHASGSLHTVFIRTV
jgi:hypothetical protein